MEPLHDQVIIQPEAKDTVSPGGIVLSASNPRQMTARVIAAGPGLILPSGERHPLSVRTGDRVMLGAGAGTEITVNGERVRLVREGEIWGVLERAA